MIWISMDSKESALYSCFSSHRDYLHYMVLPNCRDFNNYYENKIGIGKHEWSVEVYRHFVNAMESMNNVIDYLFFDNFDDVSNMGIDDFRKRFSMKHQFMLDVADIANAYKHSQRARYDKKKSITVINNDKMKARDISCSKLVMTDSKIILNFEFNQRYYNSFLMAFEFWLSYQSSHYPLDAESSIIQSLIDMGGSSS